MRFPGGSAIGIPATPSVPAAGPAAGPGWARTDEVPRVIDVFNRLYAQLKTEITTRFGGTP